MNEPLLFVYQNLESKEALNWLIFNSVVDPKLEAKITNQQLPPEEERLLQYFFKTQAACERLRKNIFEGLKQESIRILKNRKSLRWKKQEIEIMSQLLWFVMEHLREYGSITADWEKKVDFVVSKINNHIPKYTDSIIGVKNFRHNTSTQISAGKILTEEDWVMEWTKAHDANKWTPEAFSLRMTLSEEEILFIHIADLFRKVLDLCELFIQQFRTEFHFSMENIIKGIPIEIVQEKVKFTDETLTNKLMEILTPHISSKSSKHLKDFLTGKEVKKKIEFLGEKGQLMNAFWLLYKNKMLSPAKPKLIGLLVADSFVLPNCSDGPELNADRIKEALARKKAPTLYLPEIRKLAHQKRWVL